MNSLSNNYYFDYETLFKPYIESSKWWDAKIIIGVKGIGKTHSIFKYILTQWNKEITWKKKYYNQKTKKEFTIDINTKHMPWGYVRRTVGEVEEFLNTFDREWGSINKPLYGFTALFKSREVVNIKTKERLFKCLAITGNRRSRGSSAISHAGLFFDEFIPDYNETRIKNFNNRFPTITSDLCRENKYNFNMIMTGNNNSSRSEFLGYIGIEKPHKKGGFVELLENNIITYYEETNKNLGNNRNLMKNSVFKVFSNNVKMSSYLTKNETLDDKTLLISWNEIKSDIIIKCGIVIERRIFYLVTDIYNRQVWIHDIIGEQLPNITYYAFNQKDHAENYLAKFDEMSDELAQLWWENLTENKNMFFCDMLIFDILYDALKIFISAPRFWKGLVEDV